VFVIPTGRGNVNILTIEIYLPDDESERRGELVALSVLVFMLRTQDLRIIKTNMPKLMGISRCQSVYGVYGTNIASGRIVEAHESAFRSSRLRK